MPKRPPTRRSTSVLDRAASDAGHRQIREFATGQDLAAEATHWSRVQTAATTRLPTAQIGAAFLHGDTETIHCALPAEQTAQLLTSVHRAFQTEIMDILLTALGRSLKRWSGGQSTRLTLEGHGREPPDETVDLSRTVGWFTSIYPFVLTVAGEDIGEQVMAVKAALREIPRKGLGYGILRYVQDDGQIGSGPTPQLSFNYLGQFEAEGDTGLFRVSDDPSGRTIGPLLPRFHELDMAGMVTGGRMNLSLEFDTRILARETALALMEDFERQLGEVVRYCQSHAAGKAPSSGQPESPAGFPIAGEVEEAYPLSPLQEGLLFQSLFELRRRFLFLSAPSPIHRRARPGVVPERLVRARAAARRAAQRVHPSGSAPSHPGRAAGRQP